MKGEIGIFLSPKALDIFPNKMMTSRIAWDHQGDWEWVGYEGRGTEDSENTQNMSNEAREETRQKLRFAIGDSLHPHKNPLTG